MNHIGIRFFFAFVFKWARELSELETHELFNGCKKTATTARLDDGTYSWKIKLSDHQMKRLNIRTREVRANGTTASNRVVRCKLDSALELFTASLNLRRAATI